MQVESIWLGERLPEVVQVNGQGGDGRTFEEGERYLFVPFSRYDGPQQAFKDGMCSGTTEYTRAVARLAPEGAIGPQGEGPSAWLLVLVVLLAVGFWQARRARQRAAQLDV